MPLCYQRKNRTTSPGTQDTRNAKHTAFLEAGGNLKKAKNIDNVIGSYFFDIPLTQVKHYKLYTLNFNNHIEGFANWTPHNSGSVSASVQLFPHAKSSMKIVLQQKHV